MKNNNSCTEIPLYDYYYQEVLDGIERIENSLPKLDLEPNSREYLQQIEQSATDIADLAMIHGYEGVEAIAEKIISISYSLLDTEEDLDKSYCSKVEAATSAMRQVLSMEEDIESLSTLDKFHEQIELGHEKVLGYSETLPKSLNQFFKNQLELPFEDTNTPVIDVNKIAENNNHAKQDNEFDIREIEDLLTLKNDIQKGSLEKQGSELNQNEVCPNFEEKRENINESLNQEKEFTAIKINNYPTDVQQLLNTIEQAVYEVRVFPNSADAVREIREACRNLQETARQTKDKKLKLIVEPLQKLTHENIIKTKPISESISELINEGVELLHNHLDLSQVNEKEIKELARKVDKVLKVESVNVEDDQLNTDLDRRHQRKKICFRW